jgi:hypothetical protein
VGAATGVGVVSAAGWGPVASVLQEAAPNASETIANKTRMDFTGSSPFLLLIVVRATSAGGR